MRSKRFIGVASVPVRLIALALLTRMSMPPNALHRRGDRGLTRRFVADVAGDRQRARPPACSISAAAVWIVPGSFGFGSDGLGGDRDVGAVARRAQRDREADAARTAGDEERLALSERHVPRSAVARPVTCAPNCGGRLSRKAVMPSTKSARARARAEAHRLGVQLLGQRARERFADQALGVAQRQHRTLGQRLHDARRPRHRARPPARRG